jgi:hypothetical protein
MTESLSSILSQKDFSDPQEAVAIKKYVQDKYQVSVEALVRGHDLIIITPSAALTSTLRYQIPQLQAIAQTDKRIVLRTK